MSQAFPAALDRHLGGGYIPGLDAIRAISVFLVLLYHFGLPLPGGYGVVAFFVLSGFLITWLLLKEHRRTGSISFVDFYKRRTLRIFPAFYAFWVAAVVVLLVSDRGVHWAHALSAFFYVSNYYNALHGDPNTWFSHTWSLAIEEQFYLLWPAIVWLFLNKRPTGLAPSIAGAIAAVWVWRILLVTVFGVDQAYLYAALDTRFDALMVGALLAVLLFDRRLPGVWSTLVLSPVLPAVTILLITATAMGGGTTQYRDTFAHAVVPVLFGVLTVQLMTFSETTAWGWTEWGWVRYLGQISYPLYLYQQVTVGPAKSALEGAGILIQVVGVVGLTVTFASLSYFVVERPFLRLKGVPVRDLWKTLRKTWMRGRVAPSPGSSSS